MTPIVATGLPSRAPQVVAPARPRVTSDLGSPLTAAREAHGKTLAEIADTTKIPARVLAALERDDVSQLPDGIFARGVVRAYAREVGLAPDPLLAALVARRPSVAVPPWSAPDTGGERESPMHMVGKIVLGVIVGVVGVVELVILMAIF